MRKKHLRHWVRIDRKETALSLRFFSYAAISHSGAVFRGTTTASDRSLWRGNWRKRGWLSGIDVPGLALAGGLYGVTLDLRRNVPRATPIQYCCFVEQKKYFLKNWKPLLIPCGADLLCNNLFEFVVDDGVVIDDWSRFGAVWFVDWTARFTNGVWKPRMWLKIECF